MQPQIVLLKEGTETAQGKQQVVSNINACQVMNTIDDYYHMFTSHNHMYPCVTHGIPLTCVTDLSIHGILTDHI